MLLLFCSFVISDAEFSIVENLLGTTDEIKKTQAGMEEFRGRGPMEGIQEDQ